jgi:hypothetical protein
MWVSDRDPIIIVVEFQNVAEMNVSDLVHRCEKGRKKRDSLSLSAFVQYHSNQYRREIPGENAQVATPP